MMVHTPQRLLSNSSATPPARRPLRGTRGLRRAFTLLETSMALVIIGVGVLAFVESHQAFLRSNGWSTHSTTGTLLANEVREMMRHLPRHDLASGLELSVANGSTTLRGWGPEAGEVEITDFDDIDDFDQMAFGPQGDFAGPVNAYGEVIAAITPDGQVLTDGDDVAVPLEGWTQRIEVTKVEPQNFAQSRAPSYAVAANGSNPGRDVDNFPLRVTVIVSYQGPFDASAEEVSRVSWIVPETQ